MTVLAVLGVDFKDENAPKKSEKTETEETKKETETV